MVRDHMHWGLIIVGWLAIAGGLATVATGHDGGLAVVVGVLLLILNRAQAIHCVLLDRIRRESADSENPTRRR